MDSLLARIEALEEHARKVDGQLRRWRLVGCVLGVLLPLAGLVSTAIAQRQRRTGTVVRAPLTVVDPRGRRLLTIDTATTVSPIARGKRGEQRMSGPRLRMFLPNGKQGMELAAADVVYRLNGKTLPFTHHSSGQLRVYGEKGQPLAEMTSYPSVPMALNLYGRDGKPATRLSPGLVWLGEGWGTGLGTYVQPGAVEMFNAVGTRVGMLQVADGGGAMALYDSSKRKSGFVIQTSPETGATMNVYSPNEKLAAHLGATKNGGVLRILNPKGGVVFEEPTPNGAGGDATIRP